MKKIMFNDKYGLTQAVLNGHKAMTRRAVSACIHKKAGLYRQEYFDDTLDALLVEDSLLKFSPFKPGEVVAVAQSYKDACVEYDELAEDWLGDSAGWNNKMFVSAYNMPHQIRITDVRVQRLQEISDEDCFREGVRRWRDCPDCPEKSKVPDELYEIAGSWDGFLSPREAFAAIIDKVSGKGTWESNPWVFVYEFELVK